MTVSPKKNPWKKINKCVICGTKLLFEKSTMPDAAPEDGVKVCRQNHDPFLVTGVFADNGTFTVSFVVPGVTVV